MVHLEVGQLVWQTGDHILWQAQGGEVDQAAHLGGQGGQSVGVQVELGQVGQVSQTSWQHGDVALTQIQSLGSLLLYMSQLVEMFSRLRSTLSNNIYLARQESSWKIQVGWGNSLLVTLTSPLHLPRPINNSDWLLTHLLTALLLPRIFAEEHLSHDNDDQYLVEDGWLLPPDTEPRTLSIFILSWTQRRNNYNIIRILSSKCIMMQQNHIYNNILVWFHLTMNEFVSTERWESWFVLLASGIVVDNLYDSDPESVSGDPATGESRLRSWDEIIFYKIFLTHLYSASLSAAAGLSKLWPLIWWWTLLPPPLVLLLADVARDLLHKHHRYKPHYYCPTSNFLSHIRHQWMFY